MHANQTVQKVQPNEEDLCSSKDPLEDIFMCSEDPWEVITSGERYQT